MDAFLNDEAIRKMPMHKRAKLGRLPDQLTITDVVKLFHPDPDNQAERDDGVKRRDLNSDRQAATKTLKDACISGELKHAINSTAGTDIFIPDYGPRCEPPKRNSFLLHDGSSANFNYDRRDIWGNVSNTATKPKVSDDTVNGYTLIHKDDLKNYLTKKGSWPVDPLIPLAKWWPDDETQAEEVGDAGAGSEEPDKRQNQLHVLIWRVYQFLLKLKKPTAQKVWNEIQNHHEDHDTDKIIQEVDGNQILWCSGYGNEQKFQRGTLDKTLSNIKKNPPI